MRRLIALSVAACVFVTPPSAPSLSPASADAAVSVAYTLEKLTAESSTVVVAKAIEQRSDWLQLAGSRRIVTLTKLHVGETVVGDASGEVWVRTLGGIVGRTGQQVSGEATLVLEEKALIFLTRATDGAWVVTGMGQGHYPVRLIDRGTGSPVPLLAASPQVGTLLGRNARETLAQARLVGKPVADAIAAIRAVKR